MLAMFSTFFSAPTVPIVQREYTDVAGAIKFAESLMERASKSPHLTAKHKEYVKAAGNLILSDIKAKGEKYIGSNDESADLHIAELCDRAIRTSTNIMLLIDEKLTTILATGSARLQQIQSVIG